MQDFKFIVTLKRVIFGTFNSFSLRNGGAFSDCPMWHSGFCLGMTGWLKQKTLVGYGSSEC